MGDRLIQILVPADKEAQLRELIERVEGVEPWHEPSDDLRLFSVQVPAERVEVILDPIQSQFCKTKGFRAVVVPVEASLPRQEEADGKGAGKDDAREEPPRDATRISREELYADLSAHTRVTYVFMIMVVLSAIVAAVGLARNSPAIVIGAMVMAPLLGPNMALSLATTLGDVKLAVQALRANLAGLVLATAVALISGFLLDIDPASAEIAARIQVGPIDLVVALAAGIGGALAFTTGVPTSLVGVMVAVALLPPLVLFPMLLAAGELGLSLGALLLFLCNVISINLAGVATFLFQGVSPRSWWEAERSRRMTRRSLAVWISLLIVVAALIIASSYRQVR